MFKKCISLLLVCLVITSIFAIVPIDTKAASYKDEFIDAILNSEGDLWNEEGSTSYGYFKLIDLNFDGRIEFIKQWSDDSGYSLGSTSPAAVYYLKNNKLVQAESWCGLNNELTGYYNEVTNEYILLQPSKTFNGYDNNYTLYNNTLTFDGIDVSEYCYTSMIKKDNDANNIYYKGGYGDSTAKRITKSEYDSINSEIINNCININLQYDKINGLDWINYSASQKRQALEKAYDSFTYDNYSNNYELRAFTPYPKSTIGKDQDVKILFRLYNSDKVVPINKYTITVIDDNTVKYLDAVNSDGDIIATFKGINVGSTKINFLDNLTNTQIILPISVEESCEYYRCSTFPIPYTSTGSIYVDNYSCTTNSNGTHTVQFNAYNSTYAYGVVTVFDQNGDFIRCVPLTPKADGTGMEKVVNGFKYVWLDIKDIFDGDSAWYTKESNAKETPVVLNNIPKDAEIVVTADGDVSMYPLFYTGIDVFVQTVLAASAIDVKINAQRATVAELATAAIKSLPQSAIQSATKKMASVIAQGSTDESVTKIYQIFFEMFESVGLNFGKIITSTLEGMGYGVADAIITTAIPSYKIVVLVDQILEITWPITDYNYNCGRGKLEIHVLPHGESNTLANSSVIINQDEIFKEDTILDAYFVSEENELQSIENMIDITPFDYDIYNITLRRDGKEIQPDSFVTVKIPTKQNNSSIYRIENNGNLTNMNATYSNGYLTFKTDHFSYYLVAYQNGELSLDPNKVYIKTGDNYYEVEKGQKYTFTSYLGLDEQFDALDARVYYDSNGLDFCPYLDEDNDYTGSEFPNLTQVMYNYDIDGEILYNRASSKYIDLPMYTSGKMTDKNILFTGEFLVTQSTGVYEIESKIYILRGRYAGKIIDKFEIVNTSINLKTDSLIQDINPVEPYTPKLGDTDCDGEVSIMDATAIQLHIAKISSLSTHQINNADTDGDGEVSIMDATEIQLFVAKLIPALGERESITLSSNQLTMNVGEKKTLTATIKPSSLSNTTVTWSSSNSSIVSVVNGVVEAKGLGTATITAKTKSGVTAKCTITVKDKTVEVSSIKLNSNGISLNEGNTYQLVATVLPENATNKTLTWSTNNPSVATVSSSGKITAVSIGKATITAKSSNGVTITCAVSVVPIQVSSIALSDTNEVLYLGFTHFLTATVKPDNANDKSLTWSSSDTSVVTVSSSGSVTAKGLGTATVTARATNGVSASCVFTVCDILPDSMTLSKNTNELDVGQSFQLTGTITPSYATNKTITWSSSDTSVATVTQSGNVKAVGNGKATITAKTVNGIKVVCEITSYTPVSGTYELLLNLRKNPAGCYRLTADDTLNTLDLNIYTFTGCINGDGHTITIAYDSTSKNVTNNCYKAFLPKTDGAVIKNLNISGTIDHEMYSEGSYSNYCAGFVAYAENTTFVNCTNEAMIKSTIWSNYSGYGYVGGITAWSRNCSYTDCANKGNLQVITMPVKVASSIAGGISGQSSSSKFDNCSNSGHIYTHSSNSSDTYYSLAYSGGIVGSSISSNLTNCVTSGNMISNAWPEYETYYTSIAVSGGIIAYGNGMIENCNSSCKLNPTTTNGGVIYKGELIAYKN